MEPSELKPLSQVRKTGGPWNFVLNFDEIRQAEESYVQHILQIAEKHCARSGLGLKIDRQFIRYWDSLASNLCRMVIPNYKVLDEAGHLAFLRGLFEEIFDFLMFVYDGDPVYPMSEFVRALDYGASGASRLVLLLPKRARPVIATADEAYAASVEEQRFREGQMGY